MARNRRGLVIALCGPDGSGKTTVAEAIARRLDGEVLHIHHKPAFLPYPGVDPERDFTDPYAVEPRGRLTSVAKVAYLYLDWLLAWAFRFRRLLAAGGWVIIQRPWADMMVDQRRYRLNVPPTLLRVLRRLLPEPHLTVLLTAAPAVISRRKGELEADEIETQNRAWLETLRHVARPLVVDVDQDVDAVVDEVMEAIEARRRSPSSGHISLQEGRWLLPREPRRAAVTGVRIHQPLTAGDRLRAAAARGGAVLGLTRLGPGTSPPAELMSKLDPWLENGATFAARRLREGARWFVQMIEPDGTPGPALKLALTGGAGAAIDAERQVIETVGDLLEDPLATPRLLGGGDGVLVMEPVRWRHRSSPLALPLPVAAGLGRLFAATTKPDDRMRGRVHGDLAPWNIMWDGTKWFLLDWEESLPDGAPFHDLFHHYVQSHALMGHPHAGALVAGAQGRGDIGEAVMVYAEAAGLDAELAAPAFTDYLTRSTSDLDSSSRGYETARRRRVKLLEAWQADIGVRT